MTAWIRWRPAILATSAHGHALARTKGRREIHRILTFGSTDIPSLSRCSGILPLVEDDLDRDALDDFDVVAGRVLRRQQAVARAARARDVEHAAVVGAAVGVDGDRDGLPGTHVLQLRFLEVGGHPDVAAVERNDGQQLLAGRDVLSRLHGSAADESGHRRDDGGVLQVQLRLLQLRRAALGLRLCGARARALRRRSAVARCRRTAVPPAACAIRARACVTASSAAAADARAASTAAAVAFWLLTAWRVLLLRDLVFFRQRLVARHVILRLQVVGFRLAQVTPVPLRTAARPRQARPSRRRRRPGPSRAGLPYRST